jgi:hypothetical protein
MHSPDRLTTDPGKDNDNLTLIAPELFQIHALAGVKLKGDECNIL